MKDRISVSLPEDLTETLKKIVEKYPWIKSRSSIVSDALQEYLSLKFPELAVRAETVKGPRVLAYLKGVRKRAPSVSLRRTKLNLPRWRVIES